MTDHHPLTALLSSKVLNVCRCKLLEFDITITYREKKNYENADGLSRQAWRAEKDSPLTPGDCHVSQVKHDLCKGECGGQTPTMEIETLQGADMENGTVRSVRIKERKKEDWERDRRKKKYYSIKQQLEL